MTEIDLPDLPDQYCKFAEAIAAVAESHGVDQFKMTFEPAWNGPMGTLRHVHGNIEIYFKATDSRGRPGKNLRVALDTRLVHKIVDTPE